MTHKTNNTTLPLFHRSCALALACLTAFSPAVFAAGPTIPGYYGKLNLPAPAANTLPVLKDNPSGATVDQSGNQMTVTQNQGSANVVIDWSSFNIGSASTVRFYQGSGTPGTASWTPNSSYAALNRIFDQNPSQIFGKIKADGSIYLINRNGILFGPGSTVDVNTLTASALSIYLTDFNNNIVYNAFYVEPNSQDGGPSSPLGQNTTVANFGTITTNAGGAITLVGPQVENGGSLIAPSGMVNLIGAASHTGSLNGPDVLLTYGYQNGSQNVAYNSQAVPGTATNYPNGSIISDYGSVGMYGATVQQLGGIQAMTSLKKAGEIYLQATNSVTTGPGSVTSTPITEAADAVSNTFPYTPGIVAVSSINTLANTTPGEVLSSGNLPSLQSMIHPPLLNIDHEGSIISPSGTVSMQATNSIYLGQGSSIDVSGLWVTLPASANLVQSQLNSVQLADYYSQKNGTLQGQTINTSLLNGASIGDISGSYTIADETSQERSTAGGTISLGVTSGEALPAYTQNNINIPLNNIIVKQGATLNFSGGGISYQAGTVSTSMLMSGNNVYSIATAPQSIQYNGLLDEQTESYPRFGIQQTYNGLYLGGGTPMLSYSPARQVGSNAGSLSLVARTVVLDGTLNGSATTGVTQTAITNPGLTNQDGISEYDISVARGLEIPQGGTLQIGLGETSTNNALNDHIVDSIAVSAQTTPLPTTFAPGEPLNSTQTSLSAAILNNAGLGAISLYTNTTFSLDKGAVLTLAPSPGPSYGAGSTLNVIARRIEQQGGVIIPGGTVYYSLEDNVTTYQQNSGQANPLYVPLVSGVDFASGSEISVRGVTVNNSSAGQTAQGGIQNTAFTNGGKITVQDQTDSGVTTGNNLFLSPNAVLDVSGGYLINTSGTLTGGNAGTLSLSAMNISLGGELEGFAVSGAKGGTIKLQSGEINVGKVNGLLPASTPFDAPPPDYLQGKLLLADDRFSDTGFTNIVLNAVNDVTFAPGTTLEPSTMRLAVPATGITSNSSAAPKTADPVDDSNYMGSTSISATAGDLFKGTLSTGLSITPITNANITLSEGATVKTSPGGTITLTAPAAINIDGTLESLGGTITVTAGSQGTPGNITVSGYGKINAAGYNQIDTSLVSGEVAGFLPQNAGTISLSAPDGSISLNNGSVLDVSGSQPVQRYVSGIGNEPAQVTVAGNAGTLKITYSSGFTPGGVINATSCLAGCNGGTLSIYNDVSDLTLKGAMIGNFVTSGFNAFTFESPTAINFENNFNQNFKQSVTLDAPNINGNGTNISISSPWVQLINSSNNPPLSLTSASTSPTGSLSIMAGEIDLTGTKTIQGFSDVSLSATNFITFSDFQNNATGTLYGALSVAGNLSLKAAGIYPTTASQFTINVADKFTTLPSDTGPINTIYSAGGSLTINAVEGIDNSGYLFAPQGTINLNSPNGRILLANGSEVVTTGTVPVYYGDATGTSWLVNDIGGSGGTAVTGAPQQSISITGNEVIAQPGALVASNGGGGIYTALWQSGLNGTNNPLTLSPSLYSTLSLPASSSNTMGRFVILPDQSLTLPGPAVYLQAVPSLGLKAGVYSELPATQYAFLPGALVVEDAGYYSAPVTAQGYTVTPGYPTFIGNQQTSDFFRSYVVLPAASVLQQGNFTLYSYASANSGNISINAGTTGILASTFSSVPLPGGTGGVFTLNGSSLQVTNQIDSLPSGFNFSSPIPQDLAGTVQIQADSISGKGWGTISLGTIDTTNNIDVSSGSTLQAGSVSFAAANTVTLESGVQITALGGNGSGQISVVVQNANGNGALNIEQGALMHASNGITVNANSYSLQGDAPFLVDNGSLSLAANKIVFGAENSPQTLPGLYPTDIQLSNFLNNKTLTLISSTDMEFWNDANLKGSGALILDTGSISGQGGVNASITAATNLTLQNSGSTTAATTFSSGQLSLNAANININIPSNSTSNKIIDLSGFGNTAISSLNDLVFTGTGTLTTGKLNVQAAGLTVAPSLASDGTFISTGNFTINAGDIAIASSSGVHSTPTNPGGNLSITGNSLLLSGLIDIPGGTVSITTTAGITVANGGEISVRGIMTPTSDPATTVPVPAGSVTLSSANNAIALNAGSTIDVSAAPGGNAGTISLSAPAPNGGVTTAGGILGSSVGGQGASLSIDSYTLQGVGGLDGLATLISNGGFNNSISIHSHSGDLSLAGGNTMAAKNVTITADNGNLSISGTINADTNDGSGLIELNAGLNLNLEPGSLLSAKGLNGANGGNVYLNSQAGTLDFQNNSVIDTSSSASGTSGTIYFRALQNTALNTGVNLELNGKIAGASEVIVEAFQTYDYSTTLDAATMSSILGQTSTYMNNGTSYRNSLLSTLQSTPSNWDVYRSQFQFRPGIEIDSTGNISLSTLNLTSSRYSIIASNPAGDSITQSEPGVLTLRAAGNLNITGELVDAPTAVSSLTSGTMKDSWGFNLVAGADLNSANPMGVVAVTNPATSTTGNLVIGPMANGRLSVDSSGNAKGGALIYSEDGLIRFASAANTDIGYAVATSAGYMINNSMLFDIGSYGGKIIGSTGGDLTIRAGAIQTAVSDIDLTVGNDLLLLDTKNSSSSSKENSPDSIGTIRTTGEYNSNTPPTPDYPGSPTLIASSAATYWTYAGGGNINIQVGGNLSGSVNNNTTTGVNSGSSLGDFNAWDMAYAIPANSNTLPPYYYLTANYGATISSKSVNDGYDATQGIATMAGGNISISTGMDCISQIGLFGKGNLTIQAGGDVSGRYRLVSGSGTISSMGNFGNSTGGTGNQQIELGTSQVNVVAVGNMYLGPILNPNISNSALSQSITNTMWDLTYNSDTSASMVSLAGTISMNGVSIYEGYNNSGNNNSGNAYQGILPPTVELIAKGDISLNGTFVMAPSPTGNIRLIAGGDISGAAGANNASNVSSISMVDATMDPTSPLYVYQLLEGPSEKSNLLGSLQNNETTNLLHTGDPNPVQIISGGDFSNIALNFDKKAEILVKGDINELQYQGQNLADTDISVIQAGGNINYSYNTTGTSDISGILQGGPGALVVQAGGNIELGTSQGIQSLGNGYNQALGEAGAALYVAAGAKSTLTPQQMQTFFNGDSSSTSATVAAGLKAIGTEFSTLLASNQTASAAELLNNARVDIIQPLFDEPSATQEGSINMVQSQIASLGSKGDVTIMARSEIDVGTSSLSTTAGSSTPTGITTAGGGNINIYAGSDINVNQSRIMTFFGGDITIWSDQGNINAGRGSKTTVSVPPPTQVENVPGEPQYGTHLQFTPPAAGSGIRAVTYDPNQYPDGPLAIPSPGGIYGFTPQGVIDAGEAGIAGGKVVLGAVEVLNAQNISATAGSVGVPSSSAASIGIGSLSGTSGLADSSKLIEQTSGAGAARDALKSTTQVLDDFMSKFLDVKVISFDNDQSDDGTTMDNDNDKKKDKKKDKR